MSYQSHRLHKGLRHEDAVKRVGVAGRQLFNRDSMIRIDGQQTVAQLLKKRSASWLDTGMSPRPKEYLIAISQRLAALTQMVALGDWINSRAF